MPHCPNPVAATRPASGPAPPVVPAQLSPELLFPHGHGRRVFRRGGTGLSLRLAPLLCVPHASLCPALPCPPLSCSPLLSSSPLPWRSLRAAPLVLCRLPGCCSRLIPGRRSALWAETEPSVPLPGERPPLPSRAGEAERGGARHPFLPHPVAAWARRFHLPSIRALLGRKSGGSHHGPGWKGPRGS